MADMKRFYVWRHQRLIDTVYFDASMTCAEVRISLIKHDGMPFNIEVYDKRA